MLQLQQLTQIFTVELHLLVFFRQLNTWILLILLFNYRQIYFGLCRAFFLFAKWFLEWKKIKLNSWLLLSTPFLFHLSRLFVSIFFILYQLKQIYLLIDWWGCRILSFEIDFVTFQFPQKTRTQPFFSWIPHFLLKFWFFSCLAFFHTIPICNFLNLSYLVWIAGISVPFLWRKEREGFVLGFNRFNMRRLWGSNEDGEISWHFWDFFHLGWVLSGLSCNFLIFI